MPNFYLWMPLEANYQYLAPIDQPLIFDDFFEYMSGSKMPIGNFRLKLMGVKKREILNSGCCFFITAKTKDCFKNNGVTGWSTYPLEVLKRDTIISEEIFGLIVNGRAGDGVYDPAKKPYYEKFEPSTWDQSDIFIIDPVMHVLCSEKAHRVIQENKITGLRFKKVVK